MCRDQTDLARKYDLGKTIKPFQDGRLAMIGRSGAGLVLNPLSRHATPPGLKQPDMPVGKYNGKCGFVPRIFSHIG